MARPAWVTVEQCQVMPHRGLWPGGPTPRCLRNFSHGVQLPFFPSVRRTNGPLVSPSGHSKRGLMESLRSKPSHSPPGEHQSTVDSPECKEGHNSQCHQQLNQQNGIDLWEEWSV